MTKNTNRGIEWGTDAAVWLAGSVCTVIGILVVLSWHFNLAPLLRVGSSVLPGAYLGGWQTIGVGVALLLVQLSRPRLAFAIALIVGAVSALTALQYLLPMDLRVDALGRLPARGAPGFHPVRMSIVATLEFALSALGIIIISRLRGSRPRWHGVLAFLGVALIAVALVARIAADILGPVGVHRVLSLSGSMSFSLVGVAFLALAWRQEVRRGYDILHWLPIPVTIGLMLGTLVLWQTLRISEQLHAAQLVEAEAVYIENKIATELQSQVLDVVRLAGQWEQRDRPDLDRWAMDAALTVDGPSGLYALGWIDASGRVRRAVPAGQEAALTAGFRLPHARATLLAAASGQREPRFSPLLEQGQEQMLYVYIPLRQRHTGMFVGLFHPRPLLGRVLDADITRGFAVRVEAGSRVAYVGQRPEVRYAERWAQVRRFSLYGVDWNVSAIPSADLVHQLQTDMPTFVLAVGLMLSLLTGTALFLAQTARVRASDLARTNIDLVREVDERHRAADRFRRLLASAPDAVVIVDEHGKIVLTNGQAERLFGYAEQELVGQSVERLIPERFRERHELAFDRFMAHPDVRPIGQGMELYALHKDGHEIPVEISLGPLETEQGILVSAAIRDVSERRAREEALRQSEERFRLVIDGVQDYAIFMLDLDGRVASWNVGAQRMTGYSAGEIMGQHFERFFTADDRAANVPAAELAAANRDGRAEVEAWRVRKDGTRFWSNVVVTTVHDASGRCIGYAKVTRDVSERRRQELALQRQTELIELLHRIAVAANEADTIDAAMARALDLVSAITRWPVVHVYLTSRADTETVRSTALWRSVDAQRYTSLIRHTDHREFGPGVGLIGRVLEQGAPIWSGDLDALLLPERAREARAAGLCAVFAFPILVRTRVVGVLEFFSHEVTAPDAGLIEAMSHVGTQLGRVIERSWAEEGLRASEARFRSVTESASDAIISVDHHGAIVTWNQAARRLFGYPKEEILGQDFRRLLSPPHDVQLIAWARHEERIGGEVRAIVAQRRDGSEFPAEISLGAWTVGDARFFSGIVRDVTARKQAEARIRDLNETLERRVIERTAQAERARTRLAFLAEASAVLAASLDYEATLAQVARLAVPFFAEWCVVDMLTDDDTLRRIQIAHADQDKEALGREINDRYPPDQGASSGTMQVVRSGEPQIVSEISDDMIQGRDAEHQRMLRALGLRSYICVPLIARGRTLGAITFITGEGYRRYETSDLELALDLARRCATAVDNARLYEAVQDELRERQRAEREIRFQANLLSVVGQAVMATDMENNVLYWNPYAERLYGWRADEMIGTPATRVVPPESKEIANTIAQAVIEVGYWSGEMQLCRRDGTVFAGFATATPIRDADDRIIGVIGVSSDITAQKNAERLIEVRAQQQACIAELGQRALAGIDLDVLFDEAVRAVAHRLDVEMCKVLEYLSAHEGLLLRAGVGWHGALVGQARVSAGRESQAGYTLLNEGPVIVDDLRSETRFNGPPLLLDHGVVSGMSVTIPGRDGAYGVIGAHTARHRRFSEDDLHFLQAVANVLASAVERERTDADRAALLLQEQEARLAAEEARQRLAVLADASAALSVSLDYAQALDKLARLVVPAFADWCAVDVATPEGEYQRLTVAHVNPEKERAAHELQRRFPPDLASPYGYPKVLRTGKPEFYAQISDVALAEKSWDPEQLRLLRSLGYRSYICVPLTARGRVFGAISFVIGDNARSYTAADVDFAQDLARRAALALDNAQLFRAAQDELAERRRAEELLADEKERLAVTLHSIGDGVITTDAQGHIVLLNKIAEDLTGWRQPEAAGRPLTQVFHIINEKTRKPCENPVEKVLKTGKIIGLANHTALVRKDGVERIIADSGAPIRDRAGRIIGVVLVFRDITDQQKMEEDLQKSHKLESIGILAGGIAHDFNNILTAILGNISLAKMYSRPGDRISDVLTEAENAFWRARDLTQQLLTFSKGGAPIKKTASVSELLRDTSSFVLSGSNVRCRLEVDDDLWPAEFDPGQVSQVVNNLLINAQQAMPQGGVVTIRAQNVNVTKKTGVPLRKGRYVRITIEDQGVGIPEEHLHRVFDPYFTTKQTGSGLGLATSYSIVKRHDGHIDVHSQVGKGTIFTVYLPASQTALEATTAPTDETPSGHGRILFMDDEETVRRVGGEILARLGYQVEYAAEGAEMLERYVAARRAGQRFDAVIMDLTIPGGMGGKEAVAKLLEVDPDAVAIVSSGYFNDPVMADHAHYGFRGVIAKPYKVKELSDTLRAALAHR